jgi:hypothetical protein
VKDIELKIPVELTMAHIQRANPEIDEAEAETLATELHAIIDAVRQLHQARPLSDDGAHPSDEVDLALTMWCTALDRWPQDEGAAANESVWTMERLSAIGDDESLYERFLNISYRICGSDVADMLS